MGLNSSAATELHRVFRAQGMAAGLRKLFRKGAVPSCIEDERIPPPPLQHMNMTSIHSFTYITLWNCETSGWLLLNDGRACAWDGMRNHCCVSIAIPEMKAS